MPVMMQLVNSVAVTLIEVPVLIVCVQYVALVPVNAIAQCYSVHAV